MQKDKNILITGGTGFVGSYVLRYLIKKGYTNIHSLKRENSRMELVEDVKNKITFHNADITDIVELEKIIKNSDIVIHIAAVVSFKPKDKSKLMKVNVEGTANIVNLCIDNNIEKLIHVSSIAALGRSESGKTIDENSDWQDSDTNSYYAISKYLAEMEVWRGQSEGLSTVIINPSVILGAGFWDVGSSELFKKVYKGLRFFPTGTNGFVDVRDVAEMTIKLMEKNITGERFICSAKNVKLKELFTQMALHLNKKPPTIKLSTSLVAIASFILDFLSLFPGYNSNLTSQSVKNAYFDSIYDNSKSKEQLDFEYRPINQTIEETSKLFINTYPNKTEFAIFDIN